MGKRPRSSNHGGRCTNGNGDNFSAEKFEGKSKTKRPKLGPPKKAQTISGEAVHGGSNENNSTKAGEGLIPGYVRCGKNKVRISFVLKSKEEIRELSQKLRSELDKVRGFKSRIMAKGIEFNEKENRIGSDSGGGGSSRPLPRANSAMSGIGPDVLRLCDGNNLSGDLAVAVENGDRIAKERLNSGKMGGGREAMEDEFHKVFVRRCQDLLRQLMKHTYGWVFSEPVDVKKLKLHDYYSIIKNPMDLGTINKRLSKNWYKSPSEFADDMRLTFNNAMAYNEKGQDVHTMADVLLKLFEKRWATVKAKFGSPEGYKTANAASSANKDPKMASSPSNGQAHTSSVAYAADLSPPADTTLSCVHEPRSAHTPMHLETRIQGRSEFKETPNDTNVEAATVGTNEDNDPPSKKRTPNEHDIRDMNLKEKQRLGSALQNLSSEKLEGVIQILRKRKPGIFNEEDEIEVDILSFDAETLWGLHNFINPHNKSSNETMERSEHAPKALTFSPAKSAEKPVKDKEDDNARKSNSSRSLGSDSGSSSSDSGSDSAS